MRETGQATVWMNPDKPFDSLIEANKDRRRLDTLCPEWAMQEAGRIGGAVIVNPHDRQIAVFRKEGCPYGQRECHRRFAVRRLLRFGMYSGPVAAP